eukprot:4341883-Amphidinium_carterae.1
MAVQAIVAKTMDFKILDIPGRSRAALTQLDVVVLSQADIHSQFQFEARQVEGKMPFQLCDVA